MTPLLRLTAAVIAACALPPQAELLQASAGQDDRLNELEKALRDSQKPGEDPWTSRSKEWKELREAYAKADPDRILSRIRAPEPIGIVLLCALESVPKPPSAEACRVVSELIRRSVGLLRNQALEILAAAREEKAIAAVRAAVLTARNPEEKALICGALGRTGNEASLPLILKVYEEVKGQTEAAPFMEAFASIGDERSIVAIKDFLEGKEIKTHAFLALARLKYTDAFTQQKALEVAYRDAFHASQGAEQLRAVLDFWSVRSSPESEQFIQDHAAKVQKKRWPDLSEDEIISGFYCTEALAARGELPHLLSLARFLSCERKVLREGKNAFGDPQSFESDLGSRMREEATRMLGRLTGECFASPGEAAMWLDRNVGKGLRWDPAKKLFTR